MDITDKIDKVFEESAMGRFKYMKEIKSSLDFLDEELGSALKTSIDKRSAFKDLEEVTMLEHYSVRALRELKKMMPKLEKFQKSLKEKAKFLDKQGK